MASNKNDCSHFYEVTDERNGDIICTSCGLVLDVLYTNTHQSSNKFDEVILKKTDIVDYLSEMLSRLNAPFSCLSFIVDMFSKKTKHVSQKDKYLFASYCCYQTLNDLGIMTSIKMISAVTGYTVEDLSKMNDNNSVIKFDIHESLEKYCKLLNLSFHDFSLIKKTIPAQQSSGHNPLTIISAAINNYCENYNYKISLKDICNITGISKISVHRYNRNLKKRCNFIRDPLCKEVVE